MKAHQRLVRELRAKLPDPLLKEKRKLAKDFTQARVEQISYDVAKNVILRNEYLGSMGSASHCFGLYFGEYLASVVCFGSTAGTKVAESVSRYRQINLSVTGRKSGKTISMPVWFVLEEDKFYLLPVRGSDTQWYQNVLQNPQIRIDARGAETELRAKPITESAALKSVIEKFREKYKRG